MSTHHPHTGQGDDSLGHLFEEIREAETKADQILAEALSQKEKILAQARAAAASHIQKSSGQIADDNTLKIKKFYEQVSLLKESKMDEAATLIKELEKKAKKNIPATADYIFEQALATLAP